MLEVMKVKGIFVLLLCAPLLADAGCDNQSADNSSATSPTVPTAPTITEPVFAGTLKMGGVPQILTFNVTQVGPLTISLNAAGPPSTVSVGLSIGNPTFATTGTSCSPIQTVIAQGGVSVPQISGTVSVAGAYCVAVFDPGTLPNDVTFSVVIAHT